jgi:hypothetical protein
MAETYPEWVVTESERKLHDDFVYFVWRLWKHLRLPQPTKRQRNIARYLQHGPRRRMIQAWRGAAKTWLTCAYVLWRLYRNPQERIKIVSANEAKALENAVFIRRLIDEIPELQFLRPRKNGRDSALTFDVGPADAAPTPSVSALGITGQLTGGRATILVSDDIEVPKNSYTETMRERLAELIKEYDALIVPIVGEIIYLGTPQTEQSVYNVVRRRGYDCRIWPARFPTHEQIAKYSGALAEDILADIMAGAKPGTSTDPERFTDLDLAERETSYGRSGFALQFMLDTSLSDAERYPLKQADLIYFDCEHDSFDATGNVIPEARAQAPTRLAWTSDPRYLVDTVANIGFSGDRLYRPLFISQERAAFTGSVMVIDPNGRGKDETGVCVVKALMGQLYLTALKGFKGGYDDSNLVAICKLAKAQQVKHILIESNFGDGMFQKLLEPHMAKIHPCTIEEYRSTGQKELRIIEDLEPVMNQHRLVIDSKVAMEDSKLAEDDPQYSFLYQLTHITKDRGALRHEDRLEVVSRACRYYREQMAIDHGKADEAHRAKLRDEEFRKLEQAALGFAGRPKSSSLVPKDAHGRSLPGVLRKRPTGGTYTSTHWSNK